LSKDVLARVVAMTAVAIAFAFLLIMEKAQTGHRQSDLVIDPLAMHN
jgi:hypothetical protein